MPPILARSRLAALGPASRRRGRLGLLLLAAGLALPVLPPQAQAAPLLALASPDPDEDGAERGEPVPAPPALEAPVAASPGPTPVGDDEEGMRPGAGGGWERRLTLPPHGPVGLDLRNLRGMVSVRPWPYREIRIVALRASSRPAAELDPRQRRAYEGLRLRARTAGPQVTIETRVVGESGRFPRLLADQLPDLRVDCRVWVPRDTFLRVTDHAGPVSLFDLVGRFEVEAGEGAMSFTGLRGPLVAANRKGAVWVRRHRGDLKLRTFDSPVLVDQATGDVDAATAGGDLTVKVGGRFLADVQAGSVSGTFTTDLAPSGRQGGPDPRGYRGVLRANRAPDEAPALRYHLQTIGGAIHLEGPSSFR